MKKTATIIITIMLALTVISCSTPTFQRLGSVIDETTSHFKSTPTPEATALPSRTPEPTPEPTKSPEELENDLLDKYIDDMTLDEQIRQLFNIRLTAPVDEEGNGGGYFDKASDEMRAFVRESQAGGYTLFTENISTFRQTSKLTEALDTESSTTPFICIDEEGGQVSRLSSAGLKGYDKTAAASQLTREDSTEKASEAAFYIGRTLKELGINMNFAPVADVLTNEENSAIGDRSFGSDPAVVADMASAFSEALASCEVVPCAKHFPGHGSTTGDPHTGESILGHDERQLEEIDYIPFKRLIDEDIPCIMVGHMVLSDPGNEGDYVPSSLSPYFVTDKLRIDLGFKGVIITDGMDMDAITAKYGAGEAALLALDAGVDMILLPADFEEAVQAVTQAVENGDIEEERIRNSVRRILRAKKQAGILPLELDPALLENTDEDEPSQEPEDQDGESPEEDEDA